MKKARVLLVSFPLQGHINPTLQFAKVLAHHGINTTFVTTTKAYKRLSSTAGDSTAGISFATISDGTEEAPSIDSIMDLQYPAQLEHHGSVSLAGLIRSLADSGDPISCVVYNFLLPWVARVASEQGVPSALLWIQASSVLSIYYHYVHDFTLFSDLSGQIQLPGLPSLVADDLPSFLLPDDPHTHLYSILSDLFSAVKEQKTKWVLVNSFLGLEESVVSSMKELNLNLAGVGPLIPSAFLDTSKNSNDTAFGGDIMEVGTDSKNRHGDESTGSHIIRWLDSKPRDSVLYVSFGSLAMLSPAQIDEIGAGLSESGHPFIWVLRPPENYVSFPAGLEEAVTGRGMVVRWCPQVEVLAHPAISCFVTHSGWNSTLEGLTNGKPMICVPQWSDQPTNAMLVEHVWGIGVRAKKREDGVLDREELKRCISVVMEGEDGKKTKEKALKVRDLALEAANESGTSHRNICQFLDDVKLLSEQREVEKNFTD